MVENKKLKKLYGTKAEISYLFGVNIKTLGTDMTEMRRSPEFSDAILRLGQKRVLISVQGYEAYLKMRAQRQQNQG